jgi:hypothetical protein
LKAALPARSSLPCAYTTDRYGCGDAAGSSVKIRRAIDKALITDKNSFLSGSCSKNEIFEQL